jgi:hypothetical protein
LFGERPVQLVFREKLFFDMLGQFSFPVERAARHQADEKKGDRNDAEKNNDQTECSFRDEPDHRLVRRSTFGVPAFRRVIFPGAGARFGGKIHATS